MISFKDIMTRGVIYFDAEYFSECKDFCKIRGIKYLPHINNSQECYRYVGDKDHFVKKDTQPDQFVSYDQNIYRAEFADLFDKYGVLFVRSGNTIQGVVHYSDYNRSPVYEDLYKKLFLLERGLVHLIIHYSGLSKYDLDIARNKEAKEEDKNIHLTYKDFRDGNITLKIILEFVQKHDLVKIRVDDIHRITAIRNKIAHSDDLITLEKKGNQKMEYDYKSFRYFITCINSLEVALRQVGNRMYFMDAVLANDFSMPVIPLEDFLFK